MAPLELEPNIEVLRLSAVLYRNETLRLAAENARLKNERVEDQQAFLTEKIRAQLGCLTHKFFGFGREELSEKRR